MKSITVYFDDQEFDELLKSKDSKSWHDFILELKKNGEINVSN